MKQNDKIIITITDLNEDGDGIGRYDGLVVFCPGLLPGEEAEVRITKVTKSYATGRSLKLLSGSELRVESPCPLFGSSCGGCRLCHMEYGAQLESKAKHVYDCLTRIGGLRDMDVLPCLGEEIPFSGRNKLSYPFTVTKNGIECGFYKKNSHEVVPFSGVKCLAEKPLAKEIRETVCKLAGKYHFTVYNETTQCGFLRHLTVRFSEYSGKAMVILILGSALPAGFDRFVSDFRALCPSVTSMYTCTNDDPTNFLMSGKITKIFEDEPLTNNIGNAIYRISPGSFYQVNSRQVEKLYSTVYDYAGIHDGSRILDMYCGAGTIGLYVVKRFTSERSDASVTLKGIEIVPSAIEDANFNASLNGLSVQSEFILGDAPVGAQLLESRGFTPDTVILDPPRKGCDRALLDTVVRMSPAKIVYVSCKPSTLARDLRILADEGYEIIKVQPVDMFPMTGHVETVVLMARK